MNRLVGKLWIPCLTVTPVISYGTWKYYNYIPLPDKYTIVTKDSNNTNFIYKNKYNNLIKDDIKYSMPHNNNGILFIKLQDNDTFYEMRSILGSNYKIIIKNHGRYILKDNLVEYYCDSYLPVSELINIVERGNLAPKPTPELKKYIVYMK